MPLESHGVESRTRDRLFALVANRCVVRLSRIAQNAPIARSRSTRSRSRSLRKNKWNILASSISASYPLSRTTFTKSKIREHETKSKIIKGKIRERVRTKRVLRHYTARNYPRKSTTKPLSSGRHRAPGTRNARSGARIRWPVKYVVHPFCTV